MQKISRRKFVLATGFSLAGLSFSAPSFSDLKGKSRIKAVAFDAFPIFDPGPVFRKVKELFPEKGQQINEIWRVKQFSYQWLRATGKKYKNFWHVTQDALLHAADECGIQLSEKELSAIMNEYRSVKVWQDVIPVLKQLKALNLKLCFLTNMTEEMIVQGLRNSDIQDLFDTIISTDQIKTYKPDPAAYGLGPARLKLNKEEILFVAFAAWDVAGAKWFGYPTYWVNRQNAKPEKLDEEPDGTGKDLTELLHFVKGLD